MDIYSLAAANIGTGTPSAPMSARAENAYYADRIGLPNLSMGVLGSLAMTIGIFLVFGMSLV